MKHTSLSSYWAVVLCVCFYAPHVSAQEVDTADPALADAEEKAAAEEPQKVEVTPIAEDTDIEGRLMRILDATEWFRSPQVNVDEGVVFLSGRTAKPEYKEWAGKLAGKTQDVVAVVNRVEVAERPLWDLSPALSELRVMGEKTVQNSPLVAFGLILLIVSWIVAKVVARVARHIFQNRVQNQLLLGVGTKAVAIPVFLLGLYLALKVSGLSNLAMTVVGGTGLLGLAVGIAFRDIAENFLASLLISTQRPFRSGDLIEVAGHTGYVQSVTTRGTLLMTFDGNHVQIPNATIYKETITNFTSNPNVRLNFTVGVGFDCSLTRAQEIAMGILKDHPAALHEPEPVVLVEELGAATVSLRMHAWINGHDHSALKVRSALIRLTKQTFEAEGISMPDEAREVILPEALRVRMLEDSETNGEVTASSDREAKTTPEAVSNAGEGDLTSEAGEIERQARNSRPPEDGENLLTRDAADGSDRNGSQGSQKTDSRAVPNAGTPE